MPCKIVGLFARRISGKKGGCSPTFAAKIYARSRLLESVALVRLRIHFSLASTRAAQARLSSVDVGGGRHC
jgi:hypothetical protein